MLPDRIEVGNIWVATRETSRKLIIYFWTQQHGRLEQYNTVLAKLDMISSKFLPISKKLRFLWGKHHIEYS